MASILIMGAKVNGGMWRGRGDFGAVGPSQPKLVGCRAVRGARRVGWGQPTVRAVGCGVWLVDTHPTLAGSGECSTFFAKHIHSNKIKITFFYLVHHL